MTIQTEVLKLAFDLANMHHTDYGYLELRSKVRQLAKEALAQPEQEPAFHGFMDEKQCCVNICYTPWAAGGPNNELPTAYYTTPPQRKPLTDEQMWELWNSQGDDAMEQQAAIAFARAIEAAHSIKE